jgi:ankyrin repeat protein
MNKPRPYRAVFLLGAVCLLIVGAWGLSWQSHQRQEALNRQLIAALLKNDDQQALVLVDKGADPNTRLNPLPPPSFRQLWNSMLRRSPAPVKYSSTAFLIACGEVVVKLHPWDSDAAVPRSDCSELVQSMMQHGANINVRDRYSLTPLHLAVLRDHPKTVRVLLDYGADANARTHGGNLALSYALFLIMKQAYHKQTDNAATEIIQQLLLHGADPNLPASPYMTFLQMAHSENRPDLVALLRKYGAKK